MIKKFKGLEKVKKIHMIGIGGVSMSGIAIILQKAGSVLSDVSSFRKDS